jgi:FkbM family methyltransferase
MAPRALTAAKRLLTRPIPDGTPLPIVSGPLRGRWWLAGAAPGPGKGLSVVVDRSEPEQLREAQRLCRPGSICFDVGAEAGIYTLLFAEVASRVYSFEPLPANQAWLARTLARNRVETAVIVPWAMSDRSALSRFRDGQESSEGRLDPAGDRPVFAVTCDEFCEHYGVVPSVMKIDVEGAEAAVLRGATRVLRESKPAILLSTHGDQPKRDCFRLLEELGYASGVPLNGPSQADASEFSFTPVASER